MEAGVARIDITPSASCDLGGFVGRFKPSEGVHDALYAKGLVLDDGEEKVAIVSVDLLGLDQNFISSIRRVIEKEIGIKNVLIAASHTHSGPVTLPLRGMGRINEKYMQLLKGKIVRLIYTAFNKMKDVTIGAGKGKVEIGVNRRQRNPEGKVWLGENSQGIVDKEIGIIRIDDLDKKPLALIINYGCHPVVLGGDNYLISADFPGYAMKLIEEKSGAMAIFINGAAGDVNPLAPLGTFNRAQELGNILGKEALGISKGVHTAAGIKIKIFSEKVNLPFKRLPTESELEGMIKEYGRSLKELEEKGPRESLGIKALLGWAQEALAEVRLGRRKTNLLIEIQIIQLGNIAIVVIPGEVFAEIGLTIKDKSKFKYSFIAGYANGCVGYIPTKKAYQEGGYETEEAFKYYGIYSFEPRVEGEIVEAVETAIQTRF